MHRGYIKLYRCIQDNKYWHDKPFSRGTAWIDLILLANHKPLSIRKRGIKIDVERGQVGRSERDLSVRWGWSRGKVRRFLNELENEQQIVQQNGPLNLNVTSLITITNYDKYQENEPQNEPETGHKRATNSTMNKNVKNEKKETHIFLLDEFESFWSACPQRAKRCGRDTAEKAWRKHVNGNASEVIESVKRHTVCKDWTKDNGEFIPMISTWINQHRWTVEMAEEKPAWKII